jgi:nucleoside-diphosphate-sugar epimerase
VAPEAGRDAVALLESACASADAARERELGERLQPIAPADVLVTGAAGFLGRALVTRLIARGLQVRVLVRRPSAALADLGVAQQVIGDLGDPVIVQHAVRGVATVFHVGAAMRGWPQDFEAGTVWGTRNVVDACLASGSRRLVYVSSMSVFDHAGRRGNERVGEDYRYEPYPHLRGAYTRTKLIAERCVLDAIAGRGLGAIVIRPGQIFGPGAEQVAPNGVVAIGGLWLAVGPARQRLPLVYVDDVIDGLLCAADAPPGTSGVYNLVDSTPVTQADFLVHARSVVRRRVLRLPRLAMMALALPIEILGRLLRREVPLTRYRVRSLRPLDNVDSSRATAQLGWRPLVGVLEGLRRVYGEQPGGGR